MDKNYVQPLPPGVVSLPTSSPNVPPSLNPSTDYPTQSFHNSVNPPHQFHYADNNVFRGPTSNAPPTPTPQSFYPHFNPSPQFNHAQYAPRAPDQFANNFQNSNYGQFGMPTGHHTPGSFNSPMQYDGFHPQSGGFHGIGQQRAPQLVESNAPLKHIKEEGGDELKIKEENHRNKGELGCPDHSTENQAGFSSAIKLEDASAERQTQKQSEIGK